MAKIDVSTIKGYADMSAEEKIAALESYEYEAAKAQDDTELSKLKTMLSQRNSEINKLKDDIKARMTAQERAEAERAERDRQRDEEIAALRKDKTVGEYAKRCMGIGYDADLAQRAAVAMADGDTDTVFTCLQSFVEVTKKKLEDEALNRQPSLSGGMPPTTATAVDSETANMRRWMGLMV